jgi:hypothetical protein
MSLKPMFFRRFLIFGTVLTSVGFLTLALTGKFSITDISLTPMDSKPTSPLTGATGTSAPVLAVKIDDTTYAHPQVGLREAEIVYIEQVEGGLTRLAAIYASTIPSLIGPIRSARISDIELLAQYGKVGFSYSGAQRKLLPEIAAANLHDVGANRFGAAFYKNDALRNPPYAMMLSASLLMAEAESRGAYFEKSKAMGWKFGEKSEFAREISGVDISWPAARYGATWSATENRWLLNHNGSANLDSEGFHLGPANIVIQIVSITDSIYKDKVGGVTPFTATVGSGSCYLLRDGSYLPCRWNRPNLESGTTFTDLNGGQALFAPGQTWFALTSKEPIFKGEIVRDATQTNSK